MNVRNGAGCGGMANMLFDEGADTGVATLNVACGVAGLSADEVSLDGRGGDATCDAAGFP